MEWTAEMDELADCEIQDDFQSDKFEGISPEFNWIKRENSAEKCVKGSKTTD